MSDPRVHVQESDYVCPEHGNFAPARFCCACTREELQDEVRRLREGYCSEAYILMVQALDVKALGKGRRRILAQQARRMAAVGLAQGQPRSAGSANRGRELAQDVLDQVEDPEG